MFPIHQTWNILTIFIRLSSTYLIRYGFYTTYIFIIWSWCKYHHSFKLKRVFGYILIESFYWYFQTRALPEWDFPGSQTCCRYRNTCLWVCNIDGLIIISQIPHDILITGSLVRTHSGASFVINFASSSPASAWPSLA